MSFNLPGVPFAQENETEVPVEDRSLAMVQRSDVNALMSRSGGMPSEVLSQEQEMRQLKEMVSHLTGLVQTLSVTVEEMRERERGRAGSELLSMSNEPSIGSAYLMQRVPELIESGRHYSSGEEEEAEQGRAKKSKEKGKGRMEMGGQKKSDSRSVKRYGDRFAEFGKEAKIGRTTPTTEVRTSASTRGGSSVRVGASRTDVETTFGRSKNDDDRDSGSTSDTGSGGSTDDNDTESSEDGSSSSDDGSSTSGSDGLTSGDSAGEKHRRSGRKRKETRSKSEKKIKTVMSHVSEPCAASSVSQRGSGPKLVKPSNKSEIMANLILSLCENIQVDIESKTQFCYAATMGESLNRVTRIVSLVCELNTPKISIPEYSSPGMKIVADSLARTNKKVLRPLNAEYFRSMSEGSTAVPVFRSLLQIRNALIKVKELLPHPAGEILPKFGSKLVKGNRFDIDVSRMTVKIEDAETAMAKGIKFPDLKEYIVSRLAGKSVRASMPGALKVVVSSVKGSGSKR